MEGSDSLVSATRTTIRVPNDILKVLKDEADKKAVSLNSIIARILHKYVLCDIRMNTLPSITMSQALFFLILEKLNYSQKEEVARQAIQTVKDMFTVLGIEYNLQNVLDEYFTILGRHCGWFTFRCEKDENHFRIVFETELGPEWIKFLQLYVRAILQSLKINVDNESTSSSVMIFEITNVMQSDAT